MSLFEKYIFSIILTFFFSIYFCFSQTLNLYERENYNNDFKLTETHRFNDSLLLNNYLSELHLEYMNDAYLAAGYDSIIVKDSIYKAYLTQGKQFYWSDIKTDSLDEYRSILKKYKFKDKPIDLQIYDKLINKILEFSANKGYPFASIDLKEISIDDNTIGGNLIVDKKNLYFFDSIIIKGDAVVQYHYLTNYFSLFKGDVFSMKKIRNTSSLIKNISFIEESGNPELAFTDSTAELILYLKKKKANSFTGMLGILPNSNTDKKIMITGDVNLLLQNSLSRGEIIAFKWQKYEQSSQNLFFDGFYPYIFKSYLGTGVNFFMEKKDSSYLNTDLKLNLRYFTFADNGFDVFYQSFNSFVLSKISENNLNANIKTNMGGLAYKFTKLNNINNPSRGVFFHSSSAMGLKQHSFGSNESQNEKILHTVHKLNIEYYIPLFRYFSIKTANKTAFMYSPRLYSNELFRIGGLYTIRGFDELSIPASAYTMNSLELRYLFEENSAFFVFYDFAYYQKRILNNREQNSLHGIGVGLDMQTTAGVFSLVYALGKQNDNLFNLNNSKIHIGYKNSF